MSDNLLETVPFATKDDEPVNMLGLAGPGALDYTWSLLKVDKGFDQTFDESTFGIDIPMVDASLRLHASAFAELTASLKYNLGTVDIKYNVDVPAIVAPALSSGLNGVTDGLPFFSNADAVWNTSTVAMNSAGTDIVTHAGDLASSGFDVDLDWAFTAGYEAHLSIDPPIFDSIDLIDESHEIAGSGHVNILHVAPGGSPVTFNGTPPGLTGS